MKHLSWMRDPTEIRVECAWCRTHVRGHPRAEHVSHGICPSCRDTVLSRHGLPVPEQLETITN